MTGITIGNETNFRVVYYYGKAIEKFHVLADDYAFTNATKVMKRYQKMSKEDFMDLYTEFFI